MVRKDRNPCLSSNLIIAMTDVQKILYIPCDLKMVIERVGLDSNLNESDRFILTL
jgi:hypothetical protein